MKLIKGVTFFICFMCCLYNSGYAKDYDPKLGPYSNKNKFKYDAESTKEFSLHRFIPIKEKTKVYSNQGKVFYLMNTDTIRAADIYHGSWAGKKGKWILYYDMKRQLSDTYDYYVLLNEMKDIEAEAKIADAIAYQRAIVEMKQKTVGFAKQVIIYFILAISFIIILTRIFSVNSKLKKRKQQKNDSATSNGGGQRCQPYYVNNQYSRSNKDKTNTQPVFSNISDNNSTINSANKPYTPSSIVNTMPYYSKPFISGNWTPGAGNVGDTYGGPLTYGFGLPNWYGSPEKGNDGN
jgi:hypothetical protein